MAALEVQLAEAIVAELNDPARAWPLAFTADRRWRPRFKNPDLVSLKVTVVALTLKETLLDRTPRYECDYGIAIDLQQLLQVDPDSTEGQALIDGLCAQAQAVQDFYRKPHQLATMTTWTAQDAERAHIYDLDRLDEEATFETLILVTVRGFRT